MWWDKLDGDEAWRTRNLTRHVVAEVLSCAPLRHRIAWELRRDYLACESEVQALQDILERAYQLRRELCAHRYCSIS